MPRSCQSVEAEHRPTNRSQPEDLLTEWSLRPRCVGGTIGNDSAGELCVTRRTPGMVKLSVRRRGEPLMAVSSLCAVLRIHRAESILLRMSKTMLGDASVLWACANDRPFLWREEDVAFGERRRFCRHSAEMERSGNLEKN